MTGRIARNLISCWWRAVCSLGEWREVRWNKFSITHPLMPSSLHLSVASPPLMSCSFASHLHPFMFHLSLLTPLSGSQASCVLGFFFLLPHCIIFSPLTPSSVCASSPVWDCYCRSVNIHKVWPRPWSFNLCNKLSASFSPVMFACSSEGNVVFFILYMCQQCHIRTLSRALLGHLAYRFISWLFTHRVCCFCL